MAKGVAHAGRGKNLSVGEANENERRAWSEESYRRKNQQPMNNYDFSRKRLNFEIFNGEIITLGSQKKTLYQRYIDILEEVDFKQYKDGATNQQHTYVELILSGSTDKMQRLAFGSQAVNYERNPNIWHNWHITRTHEIEEWAVDCYNFVCRQYGKENVLGFEVHLDETAPHAHVNIVPTAIMKQRGNVSGYVKVDADGNPEKYSKGKHIGETKKISDKKYEQLSDEKKRQYRKNMRGTVRTISYASLFGSKLEERSQRLTELHNEFYNQVGAKWGFERGDVLASLAEEERRQRRHKTKKEAYEEQQAKNAKDKAVALAKQQQAIVEANAERIKGQQSIIDANQKSISKNNEWIKQQEASLENLNELKEQAVAERDVALKDKHDAEEEFGRSENILLQQAKKIGDNKAIIEGLQKEIDLLSGITNVSYQNIEHYVKALENVQIIIPKDIINKLKSPLKNHPRIMGSNPPLTVLELEKLTIDETQKVVNNISLLGTSKKNACETIRAILTDKQTILFDVVSKEQKAGIREANKTLYKDIKQQLAVIFNKAKKYDAYVNAGITASSYEEMKKRVENAESTSKKLSATEEMLEFAWPGVTKAKDILIDPQLDKDYMTNEQKDTIKNILSKKSQNRLKDMERLICYASSFREDISKGTKAEAYEIAAEGIVNSIAEKGYDLVGEAATQISNLADNLNMSIGAAAQSAAATAVCLIFGYLEAATIISESNGGGGGENHDLPKKKDDEDERQFYSRCLHSAIGMMKPKQIRQRQRKRGLRR